MILLLRILAGLFGLLFAGLGLMAWAAPERLAMQFGLATLGPAGLANIRADMGGMFLALAGFCLAAAALRRRWPGLTAAGILAIIVIGRLVAFLAGDGLAIPSLTIEVVACAVLASLARLQPARSGELKRGLSIAAGAVVVVAGVILGALATPQVQDRLFQRFVQANMTRDNSALLKDDALRVAFCGTSAPLPSRVRAKACVAVFAGGKFYIVDVGPESVENLMLWGVPLDRIGGVFLTHFHSDHIGDLGELNLQTWVPGRPAPLQVYGGPGVEQVVAGFNTAYGQDQGYRTAHHTAQVMPAQTWPMVSRPIAMPAGAAPRAIALRDGDLTVTAIETNHAPVRPAYAYRFDYRGRSLVITGDTTADPRLTSATRGADVLISEGLNREMIARMEAVARGSDRGRIAHIMRDIQSYHISPTEAAEAANQAGAKLLVLYHLLPAPDNALARRLFARGLNETRKGDWSLAEDGSLYVLPVGSEEIQTTRVAEALR